MPVQYVRHREWRIRIEFDTRSSANSINKLQLRKDGNYNEHFTEMLIFGILRVAK